MHVSSIGALLIERGALSPADAERVMRLVRAKGLRFGNAAIKLGLVTREQVQQALAQQFDYPYLQLRDDSLSRELIAAYAPFSPSAEALRTLRTQLVLRWLDVDAIRRTLALVSTARGDGRSYLAANLAVVFSQLGERTLLVDADLRNPRQHELFRISNRIGLSTVLARRADESPICRIRGLLDLSVLPAGASPPNPLELLTRGNFAAILADLSDHYDIVIIDTPAAELGWDFQSIAAVAQGTLLLLRRNVTRAVDARAITKEVTATGAHVAGVVLNDR